MVNSWIAHIKSVAKAKGIKYNEAMKIAGKTYKGGKSAPVKKGGKKKMGKKMKDEEDMEMEDEPKKKKRGRPKKK